MRWATYGSKWLKTPYEFMYASVFFVGGGENMLYTYRIVITLKSKFKIELTFNFRLDPFSTLEFDVRSNEEAPYRIDPSTMTMTARQYAPTIITQDEMDEILIVLTLTAFE